MSLTRTLIEAAHAKSTHHKLVLDALPLLNGADRDRWENLFLYYHSALLTGAKDPDTKFKDFTNHVLHVSQNYWGGARQAARKWYTQCVDALRQQAWKDAVYAAGVLSHYYSDPIQPFHTGQSVAENNIHRAAEWSITTSYDDLRRLAEQQGAGPDVAVPAGQDWLEQMVAAGADVAHPHYQTLIDHYDFRLGSIDPPSGLDHVSCEIIARLLRYATVGIARIFERAIAEAGVAAPYTNLTPTAVIATLQMPAAWVLKRIDNQQQRSAVRAMFDEYQLTGKVEATLPADDRAIRAAVAELPQGDSGRPMKMAQPAPLVRASAPRPAPTPETVEAAGRPTLVLNTRDLPELATAPSRLPTKDMQQSAKKPATAPADKGATPARAVAAEHYYLELDSPVEDGPSIGPKTADRLRRIGIATVSDLLAADATATSASLKAKHITRQTIVDWQDQALLVCRIPELRGHDAQLLVACNYRTPPQVAAADAGAMLKEITTFAATAEGQRVLRSGKQPDRQEIEGWMQSARGSRSLRAA